jgi:uncharacterized protein
VGIEKKLILRDPIHGFVPLSTQEWKLIDTPPMQRLRGVKQLGLTDLVYPSAVHTRFSHSIGAMHVAGMMAGQLPLDKDDARIARLCLLLHDIGHGPFSHLFDFICDQSTGTEFQHEQLGWEVIKGSDEIMTALGDDADRVLAELSPSRSIVHDIVSGGIDADKLDYLRRDSHFAGVNYGRFDFDRILWTLDTDGGHHIAIQEKGMDSIEGLRLARQQMHLQVYTHQARLIADQMLIRIVRLGVKSDTVRASPFRLKPSPRAARTLLRMDDHWLLQLLAENSKGPARELLIRLTQRKLLKRGLERSIDDIPIDARTDIISGRLSFQLMEHEVARAAGVRSHLVFVVAPRIDNKQYHGLASGEPILVKLKNGDIKEFGRMESVRDESQSPIRKVYVFGPEEAKPKIERASIAYLTQYRHG